MQIQIIEVGYLKTNCYLLEKNHEYLIIDPGDDFEIIDAYLNKKPLGILITHKHFDHIGALNQLTEKYQSKVYNKDNLNEGIMHIGPFHFEVIYNPGHSSDSISFLFDKDLFAGDFIFKDTIGRTDLPTGNMFEMKKSIKRILTYPLDLKIYPGHGSNTLLAKEVSNLKSFL